MVQFSMRKKETIFNNKDTELVIITERFWKKCCVHNNHSKVMQRCVVSMRESDNHSFRNRDYLFGGNLAKRHELSKFSRLIQ